VHLESNNQQAPVQEVQHVRIGAGQGSGVRVKQYAGGVQRRHLGKSGDVQENLQVPRDALARLRDAVSGGRTDEALATLDGWIGAVEAAESVPPPAAEQTAEVSK